MTERIQVSRLQVSQAIHDLVKHEIIPGTGIDLEAFWQSFSAIIDEFAPKNRQLLKKRDQLQAQIDAWHQQHNGRVHNPREYKAFLTEIDYLVPEGEDFSITTENVDPEIAQQAGPQLVVPVMNARFALNAANARWGSLYDGLYGTDVLPETGGAEKTAEYNPVRGALVIAYARKLLDDTTPLAGRSHKEATQYRVIDGQLQVVLDDGAQVGLSDPGRFVGYRGEAESPDAILLKNNNIHMEVQVDRSSQIGSSDAAGVKDILMEAALTTIMDCEDSVAAVDAEDKALVYRNWLGLMKGDLEETLNKAGKTIVRRMNSDREYTTPAGDTLVLPGRSLLFVRNVGHLMTNPAILDAECNEIPEGIMDAMITSLIAIHDLKGNSAVRNSKTGSVYIVKPKMHGPEEVAFTNDLFIAVEDALAQKYPESGHYG